MPLHEISQVERQFASIFPKDSRGLRIYFRLVTEGERWIQAFERRNAHADDQRGFQGFPNDLDPVEHVPAPAELFKAGLDHIKDRDGQEAHRLQCYLLKQFETRKFAAYKIMDSDSNQA